MDAEKPQPDPVYLAKGAVYFIIAGGILTVLQYLPDRAQSGLAVVLLVWGLLLYWSARRQAKP